MIRIFSLLFLVFFAVCGLAALSIGRVTALEGEVSLWRDGKAVDPAKIAVGMDLEADDALATGPLGKVELALDKALGVPAAVRLSPGSTLALDATAQKREQSAALELLQGSLAVALNSVAGSSRLEVRVGNAVLTAKAASFTVTLALGGEFSVATSVGKVQCRVADLVYQSEPGAVVVVSPNPLEGRSLSASASTLDAWSQTWKTAMDADIKTRALAAVKFYAARYQQKSGELQRAWERWDREGAGTWNLWKTQDASGKFSSAEVLAVEKKTLGGIAITLRRAAAQLEPDALRLGELRSLLQQGVLSDTQEVSKGYTLKDFYRQFDKDSPVLAGRFAQIRWFHKDYVARNAGEFPSVVEVPEVTKDSPFFN